MTPLAFIPKSASIPSILIYNSSPSHISSSHFPCTTLIKFISSLQMKPRGFLSLLLWIYGSLDQGESGCVFEKRFIQIKFRRQNISSINPALFACLSLFLHIRRQFLTSSQIIYLAASSLVREPSRCVSDYFDGFALPVIEFISVLPDFASLRSSDSTNTDLSVVGKYRNKFVIAIITIKTVDM